jgi:hypothetical protein
VIEGGHGQGQRPWPQVVEGGWGQAGLLGANLAQCEPARPALLPAH